MSSMPQVYTSQSYMNIHLITS